jgi:hypothetical protein
VREGGSGEAGAENNFTAPFAPSFLVIFKA